MVHSKAVLYFSALGTEQTPCQSEVLSAEAGEELWKIVHRKVVREGCTPCLLSQFIVTSRLFSSLNGFSSYCILFEVKSEGSMAKEYNII